MTAKELRKSRLRLAQRLLIAACDADKTLLYDEHWQKAMEGAVKLLEGDLTEYAKEKVRLVHA